MAKLYGKILIASSMAMCMSAYSAPAAADGGETSIRIYDEAIFFDGYNVLENLSDESKAMIPEDDGILRHSTSLYSIRLTDEQLDLIGENLKMLVDIGALCDNYDRIGNINIALVPKGAESYVSRRLCLMSSKWITCRLFFATSVSASSMTCGRSSNFSAFPMPPTSRSGDVPAVRMYLQVLLLSSQIQNPRRKPITMFLCPLL